MVSKQIIGPRDVSETIDVKWDPDRKQWEARSPGKYTYHQTKEAAEAQCESDALAVETPKKPEPVRVPVEKPIRPVKQRLVDDLRKRAGAMLVISRALNGDTSKPGIQHIWFPRDHMGEYEVRWGNPPSDSDRPPHLRGLNLWIDVPAATQRLCDVVRHLAANKATPEEMHKAIAMTLYLDAAQ